MKGNVCSGPNIETFWGSSRTLPEARLPIRARTTQRLSLQLLRKLSADSLPAELSDYPVYRDLVEASAALNLRKLNCKNA